MRILNEDKQHAIAEKIVVEFGNGVLKEGVYLLDQINGVFGDRIRLSNVLPRIVETEVVVLFDKHPDNHRFALDVMEHLGVSNAWGLVVPREHLQSMLAFIECDLYVTTQDGHLIFVACHEDQVVEYDRTVWCPKPAKM